MVIVEVKKNVGVEGIDVEGVIENVYERSTGEGEYGEWSLQNIILTDSTGKIKVCLKNRDELSKGMEGRHVKFNSFFSEKHNKKVGVKIAENDYKGKKSVEIHVTKTADMEIIEGGQQKAEVAQVVGPDEKTKSMILSYAKDLTVASINAGWCKDRTEAGAAFVAYYKLLISPVEEIKTEVEPF